MNIMRQLFSSAGGQEYNHQEQPPPIQGSSQTQKSHALNTGTTQPGSPPDHKEQVTVNIKGRQWYVALASEHLVKECQICMDGVLADTSTCGDINHRLCKTCFDNHVASRPKPSLCPYCNLEIIPHDSFRDRTDKGLNAQRQLVTLQCAECNLAPVTLNQMEVHITVCKKEIQSCSHAGQGCDWAGLMEDKDRHEKLCDWRSVPCSHAQCTQQLVYCQRDEHETRSCPYRPASLGSLQTTHGTLLQLQAAQLFFQQNPGDTLAALPESAARKQLQEQAQLFPLLYEAVQQTTAASARPSGFSCDSPALARASQAMPEPCTDCGALVSDLSMPAHREACPRCPLNCCWCLEQHPREEFATRVATCLQTAAAFARWGHLWGLQGEALGPVYKRTHRDGGSIMIRLPKAPLVRAMAGLPGATHSLHCYWKPMDCQVSISFQKDSNGCIPVDINCHCADSSLYYMPKVEIRSETDGWLQNLEDVHSSCPGRHNGCILIKNDCSVRLLIRLSNSLAATPHSCVCLLLPDLQKKPRY